MRIPNFIAVITFIMIMAGCTKDFHADSETTRRRITIEGSISTMRGPYHIRITRSGGLLSIPNPAYNIPDNAEPIKEALVIITDNDGTKDTLIPAPRSIERYKYIYYNDGRIDSFLTTTQDLFKSSDNGFYQTTKIKGQPGHTYQLRVKIGELVFQSSAYMPPVPALEHLEYRDTTVQPYPNSGEMTYAFFKDPPGEKNYYLLSKHLPTIPSFDHNNSGSIRSYYPYDNFLDSAVFTNAAGNLIQYYAFDDKLLSPDLNMVPVRFRAITRGETNLFYPYGIPQPYPVQIRLQSLTKEFYNYLEALAKQREDDGNIYKPVPSSAPGNISGGALGFFFAIAVSDKLIYPR